MIAGNDLMALDSSPPFGVDPKIVVVQPMPGGGGADALVIVANPPVVLLRRVAQDEPQIIPLGPASQVRCARIINVLRSQRQREWTPEKRSRLQQIGRFPTNDYRVEIRRVRARRRGAGLVDESLQRG